MDTLTERLNAIIKTDAEMVQEWAQLIAESAVRLAQTQLDTVDRVFADSNSQYQELLEARQSTQFISNLPRLYETFVRHASEATCQYLDTAVDLQTVLIRIFQSHLPVLNQRFLDSVDEATRVAASVGALERFAPQALAEDEESARAPA
jgi:hypothetical protein